MAEGTEGRVFEVKGEKVDDDVNTEQKGTVRLSGSGGVFGWWETYLFKRVSFTLLR